MSEQRERDLDLVEMLARLDAHDAKLDRLLALLDADASASEKDPDPERLLTAAELAARLGVTPDHVYRHQNEYGVIRLGAGPCARLRFPPDAATARLTSNRSSQAESPVVTGRPAVAAKSVNGTKSEWRPIRAPRRRTEGPSRDA